MRHKWEPEDLIASWTLVKPDWDLVANKTGATRLGFSECTKADRVGWRGGCHGSCAQRSAAASRCGAR
ncbi:MAG: hypothetical protein ACRDQ6_18290 [Pseudonocardiaceae bacterium]